MLARRGRYLRLVLVTLTLGVAFSIADDCNDNDLDGYFKQPACGSLIDCNDLDWATHPVNDESCNGFDDDCDGTLDEGCAVNCSNPEPVPLARSLTPLPGGFQYSPVIARGLRSLAVSRVNWDPENCYQLAVTILNDDLTERAPPVRLKAMSGPSTALRYSAIAWVEDRYVVAWAEGLADSNCELFTSWQSYFAIIAVDGRVLVPPTSFACVESPGDDSAPYAMATLGDTVAILFGQGNGTPTNDGTWLTRIDKYGSLLDGCGIKASDSPSSDVTIASSGTEFGVAKTLTVAGVPFSTSEIFFRRYSATLQPIDAEFRRMTFDATASIHPAIVWGPGEWAIAWEQDFVDGYHDIGFMRVNASGDVVTPPGVVKATSGAELPGANDRLAPTLAWTGGEYGIAYHENSNVTGAGDIKLSRLSSTGVDLGPDPVLTPDQLKNAMFARLVWNGTDYTMTWQDRTTASGPFEAMVQRIGCNCTDADRDGFSTCRGDCDDTRFQVRPIGVEVCNNGLDDNCDGARDCQDAVRCPASGALPASPSGLVIGADEATISWQPVAGASRYDVARGSLTDLFVEGRVSSAACLASDITASSVVDDQPLNPLAGYFYLVRSEAGAASQCLVSGWGVLDESEVDACP